MPIPSRLILGGHSFIAQLGSDPMPDEKTQDAIVAACLDHGITTFDTTYLPERLALGKALRRLGRRNEAQLVAWNFFTPFDAQGAVGGHEAYAPHHLAQILRELQTDRIEYLVIHSVPDPAAHAAQESLALKWQQSGAVKRIGTWMPPAAPPAAATGIYTFAIAPCNVLTPDAESLFKTYKDRAWETWATSPFVRGWELEKRSTSETKAAVADQLLRYSAFTPHVDRLIVSMRDPRWVAINLESLNRGPLDEGRRAELTR